MKELAGVLLVFGFYWAAEANPSKCHELAGEDASVNFEEALMVYRNCFLFHLENFRHLVAREQCQSPAQHIEDCDSHLSRKTIECDSTDSEYFPRYLLFIIGDYAKHLCINSHVYKIPILLDHKTCFPSLENVITCFERFRFFNLTTVSTEEEMCSDILEVKECIVNYIGEVCPKDEVFLGLVRERFDYDDPICSSSPTETYSYLLLAAVAVSNLR